MTLRNLSADDPSVTFDFRKSKYLDPRITFTRASYADSSNNPINKPNSGTGTAGGKFQEFNINVPRLTAKGLLIEESRTNTITTSTVFDTAGFQKSGFNIADNAGVAPDGTTTAASILEKTGTNMRSLWLDPISTGAASSYAQSVFVKGIGRDHASLRIYTVIAFLIAGKLSPLL